MDHPLSNHVSDHLKAKIIPVQPFDIAVFGGTGDLSLRKLMPSLYYRYMDKQMPEESGVIGVSRSKLDGKQFRKMVHDHLKKHVGKDYDKQVWDNFASRLDYAPVDVYQDEDWAHLKEVFDAKPDRIRVFYLSVSPELFGLICRKLHENGLITEKTRVVLEKPIGHSLETAQAINNEVGSYFREDQIYRIDHYLGKETVQNLMALRFANSLFEPLWNRQHVDHVQITVAESIGIGSRGGYYNTAGALRDMVQNHLMQLLCLVGMEPPREFEADAVRDEKLKVLRALRPIDASMAKTHLVMGQYRKGAVGDEPVRGYLDEEGIPPHSATETYVALKTEIDNWRWSGVPFYLRTGKRMPVRTSEIVIEFRKVPHLIFPKNANQVNANRLVIRLQPDEGIRLYMMTKAPGPGGFRMQIAPLNLSFAETFKTRYPDGYERLVMDVVRGNPTLFMRRDEVEEAWRWAESILGAWAVQSKNPAPYTSGTWGPSASIALIERDGRTWYEYGA